MQSEAAFLSLFLDDLDVVPQKNPSDQDLERMSFVLGNKILDFDTTDVDRNSALGARLARPNGRGPRSSPRVTKFKRIFVARSISY